MPAGLLVGAAREPRRAKTLENNAGEAGLLGACRLFLGHAPSAHIVARYFAHVIGDDASPSAANS
jgi:hypothetical protein